MKIDWYHVNTFKKQVQEITEYKNTILTTLAYIILEFSQDGMKIKIEKNLWIQPSINDKINYSAYDTFSEDAIVARIKIFEKCWYYHHGKLIDLPNSLNQLQVINTMLLLQTATGNDAVRLAYDLFFQLEIEPAYYNQDHWIRHLLPVYWKNMESFLKIQKQNLITKIMTE